MDFQFPERLERKDGDEEHEEAVRPFGVGHGNQNFTNLGANMVGLLRATNPHAGETSDEDAEDSGDESIGHKKKAQGPSDPMAHTTIIPKSDSQSRRRPAGHKLMQSVPMLSKLSSRRSKKKESGASSNLPDESASESSGGENSLAPHMSRILEARAVMESRSSFDMERHGSRHEQDAQDETDQAGLRRRVLAKRLQEIFKLEEPEEVLSGQAPALSIVKVDQC